MLTTADRRRAVHVLPVNDLREHDETEQCWCQPRVERVRAGRYLISHHAADGRDLIETHGIN